MADRLTLNVEARIDKLEKSMARAANTSRNQFRRIEADAKTMATRVNQTMGTVGAAGLGRLKGAAGGLLALLSVKQIAEYGETWTRIGNVLRAAGTSVDALAAKQQTLANISADSNADLETTAKLYARLSQATKAMGVSDQEVLTVVETLNKQLALGGSTTQEAAGALTQFAQALGAGALRGDELNSILEGAPGIARAIAKEFNVSVGQLKALGEQGALTSQRVIAAIVKVAPETAKQFSEMSTTGSAALEKLSIRIQQFRAAMGRDLGTAKILPGILNALADGFARLTPDAPAQGLAKIAAEMDRVEAEIKQVTLARDTLANSGGITVKMDAPAIAAAERRIAELTARLQLLKAEIASPNARVAQAFAVVAASPLREYTPTAARPTTLGGAGGGSGGGGGGGGSSGPSAAEQAAQRRADGIKEVIEALKFEQEQLGRTAREQEVYNRFQQAGISASDPAAAGIRAQTEKLYDLEQAQKATADRISESTTNAREFAGTLAHGLKDGESALASLRSSLDRLSDKFLDSGLDMLFGMGKTPAAGSASGGVGGLAGGLGGWIKGLFGFASGGSFNVGGSGGIDSQLVAFRASPNERVDVTKPGQQRKLMTIVEPEAAPFVTAQRMGPDEVRIMARAEAKQELRKNGAKVVAGDLNNPNGRMHAALKRTTTTTRRVG